MGMVIYPIYNKLLRYHHEVLQLVTIQGYYFISTTPQIS